MAPDARDRHARHQRHRPRRQQNRRCDAPDPRRLQGNGRRGLGCRPDELHRRRRSFEPRCAADAHDHAARVRLGQNDRCTSAVDDRRSRRRWHPLHRSISQEHGALPRERATRNQPGHSAVGRRADRLWRRRVRRLGPLRGSPQALYKTLRRHHRARATRLRARRPFCSSKERQTRLRCEHAGGPKAADARERRHDLRGAHARCNHAARQRLGARSDRHRCNHRQIHAPYGAVGRCCRHRRDAAKAIEVQASARSQERR